MYTSQCITAERNCKKKGDSMKKAQPAEKSRALIRKIKAAMTTSSTASAFFGMLGAVQHPPADIDGVTAAAERVHDDDPCDQPSKINPFEFTVV